MTHKMVISTSRKRAFCHFCVSLRLGESFLAPQSDHLYRIAPPSSHISEVLASRHGKLHARVVWKSSVRRCQSSRLGSLDMRQIPDASRRTTPLSAIMGPCQAEPILRYLCHSRPLLGAITSLPS